MTSHELARLLLEHQDLPVATHAMGHTYFSEYDRLAHGPLQVCVAPGRALNWATDDLTLIIGGMVTWKYPGAALLHEEPRESLDSLTVEQAEP